MHGSGVGVRLGSDNTGVKIVRGGMPLQLT